ncbi:MAG: tetratricopeptide repeat protein [Deltaproteobacteria bacterium]|nr:tetratricopeptide repeat protein [Deltaproteobacteria bacterium]
MKNSNTIIVGILALVLGFIGGLFWSAQNETPQQTFTQVQRPAAGPSSELSNEDRNLLRQLQDGVERDGTSFQALVKLANFYFDHESYHQAITYYEKTIAVKPNEPDVLTDLGIMYRRVGNPEKAVSLFQRARKVDPAHENATLNLGIVYFHDLNDKASALKAWEDYLSLGVKGDRVDQIRRTVEQLRKSLDTSAP